MIFRRIDVILVLDELSGVWSEALKAPRRSKSSLVK